MHIYFKLTGKIKVLSPSYLYLKVNNEALTVHQKYVLLFISLILFAYM